jgi:hypothetical protein
LVAGTEPDRDTPVIGCNKVAHSATGNAMGNEALSGCVTAPREAADTAACRTRRLASDPFKHIRNTLEIIRPSAHPRRASNVHRLNTR